MKITDNVYALDSTKGSYAYAILGQEAALVDTSLPGRGEAILAELKSLNVRPEDIKNIYITHHDVDHIGSAAFLHRACHATLWASDVDIPYIYREKPRHGIKRILTSFFKAEMPRDIVPYPAELKLGEFEIIPTPGHTPGHVCLLYRDVLFAGDLVSSRKGVLTLSPGLMTWDSSLSMESIKQMGKYPFKWVCPAHGGPVERGDQWEALLR
jgi:glyoxylase-like metal-dependent hydrolase (beta-lactamase superfamily II)